VIVVSRGFDRISLLESPLLLPNIIGRQAVKYVSTEVNYRVKLLQVSRA